MAMIPVRRISGPWIRGKPDHRTCDDIDGAKNITYRIELTSITTSGATEQLPLSKTAFFSAKTVILLRHTVLLI